VNTEEHQKKADSGRRLIDTLASLKLTVLLLILSMILILLGTLEQVHWGIWHVQKVYFSSWLCFYPMDPTAALRIPLPAGFTLGALLIINLAFAHVRHFKATAAKVGNLMIHAGLLLLLGGGFVTAIYQEESAMIIPEGEKRNYSEAFREFEIALVEKSPAGETVVAIPDSILRTIGEKIVSANKLSEKNTTAAKKLAEETFAYALKMPPKEAAAFLKNAESKAKKVSEAAEEKASLAAKALLQESLITLPGTPYTLVVQTYHPNAMLRAKSQMPEGLALTATQGIGARTGLAYKPLPESFDDNKPNAPTAIVELKTKEKSLGTWALNLNLTESFDAQTFEDAGKTYELSLRRTRYYVPFTVQLDKFTHEKYPGTETPRRFASDVTLKEDASSFPFNISMNQPLRHAGLTFFQSSFGSTKDGKNLSVLQVVRNPGWLIPYISVALMSLGLVWHFGVSLLRFLRGRNAKATAAVLALGLLTHSASAADAIWNTRAFGDIPVQSGGRIIPIETLATGSLLQMRSRTSISLTKIERIAFGQRPSTWTKEQREEIAKEIPTLSTELQALLEKRPVRLTGGSISSVDWLIEVSFRAPIARHLPTFRVEHPNVLKRVGGDPEKSLYVSWDGILKNSAELSKAAEQARKRTQADRDSEERALLQLESAARQYATLSMTFIPGDLPADVTPRREYGAWISALNRALTEMNASRESGGSGKAFDPELQKTVKTFVERYQDFEREGVIGLLPPKDENSVARWDNLGASLLGVIKDQKSHRAGLAEDGVITRYADFSMAWREGKDDECSRLSSAIAASLKGPWTVRAESEASFGRLQPFYWLLIAYVLVVLMVLVSWVTGSEDLRVWGYRLLLLSFILHTAALGYRMWLHGRPPVTNLYSTGIFVAWGAVGLGIMLERVWKNGIGAAATGITGFVSLIIAHNLGLSGEDNLESVRAVLDTNFWLATHVTIVTLGYSATFVAGLLGALHLALRAFKSDYNWGDSVARAAYGILAFAVMASFIGTMLGGIWADQSWGRFWGWDPKENGAILIVLWCALCLHARWGGLVRREGLMQLLIFGNMVTAWSWFGTNLLGVGLHSYGFTESGFFWLMIFWASQLALIALGWLPDRSKSVQTA
jgi:ABC-type transport system involved in cytochrome c biogenesis permease subunit